MLRLLFRWVLIFITFVFFLAALLFTPIDTEPIEEKSFYKKTMQAIDQLELYRSKPVSITQTGWFKINITPSFPMHMAGYAPRDHFDAVHDSVFIRGLIVSNGNAKVYFISADLLIFPPVLKEMILKEYSDKYPSSISNGSSNFYFMASHAHSSLGTWDDSLVGRLILGSFNEEYWSGISKKVINAVETTEKKLIPSKIYYLEPDASDLVENRLDYQNGAVDGKIRSLKIVRNDSTKALMMTFSAHPTNISHLSLTLSGDYPNALIKRAEQDVDFAMFGTGMVGSHRVKGMTKKEFEMCDELAEKLYSKIESSSLLAIPDSLSITQGNIPVEYGKSQMHVFQKFAVRDWAFNTLLRPLHGGINYCKMGPILFLGTPCDFSGEIFREDKLGEFAEAHGEKLFITSFNGDYTGYITYDKHYGHTEQEEVMALNWVGPGFGKYYSDVIKKLVEKK